MISSNSFFLTPSFFYLPIFLSTFYAAWHTVGAQVFLQAMNEQTLTRAGQASVTPAASGRGLPSSANLCRLPGLPSLLGLPCWLFLLQSQTGLCWEVANGCGREAGPATRPRYNCTARARASLLARTLARVMAAVSVVSTLATRLLRPAQSCRLRHRPFHVSVVR